MRYTRKVLVLLLAALFVPLAASAQQRSTHVITVGKRGWLGISYNFTATLREGKRTETLTVFDVVKDSPAERAGVQRGDRILRIDGRPVTEDNFSELAGQLQPGDKVSLRIATGDRERDVTLTAADRPAQQGMSITLDRDSINAIARIYLDSARAGMFRFDSVFGADSLMGRFPGFPDIRVLKGRLDGTMLPFDTVFFGRGDGMRFFMDSVPRVFRFNRGDLPPDLVEFELPRLEMMSERGVAGAEFTPITEGLGDYFGTDRGILVVRVGPDTPAARAGLVAGDVITKIDGKVVGEVGELRRAVARAGNAALKLDILRKGKPRALELNARTRR